jgi:hypothetical protein
MEVFMPQKHGVSWRVVVLSLITVSLFLVSGTAEAKNPDLSYWTKNLSESAAQTEPGLPDGNPEIAVSGNTVHVIWFTGSPYNQLYYRRSTDGGQTWEPKQLLFTYAWNNLLSGATLKRMVVEGDYVHIAVCTTTNLYYLRSANQGASFEAERNLYTAASLHSLRTNYIAASDGKLTICFLDNFWYSDMWTSPWSGGRVLNSDDHGVNFSQHTVFDHIGSGYNIFDLLRVGDRIYVLYTDHSYYYGMIYGRLYLAVSSNAAAPFTENFISVPSKNGEHKTQPLQDSHYVAKMAGAGNNVSVIWPGMDADDVLSVFYRKSADSGVNFSEAQNFSREVIPADRAIQYGQETLAARGNYVYALFLTTGGNVYLRRSVDGGANFLGLQELSYTVPHFAGGSSLSGGWWPVLALDPRDAIGASVHSSWNSGAYVYSTDGGATFTAPEQFLPRFSLQASNRPQMAIGSDGRPHFVSEANFYYPSNVGGVGDLDIFYRALSPALAPSGANNALSLESNTVDYRFDNMQVLPSSYLNFTSQMTGEVWVRPYAGGKTTGSTSVVKPIFHKNETNYLSYALQTFDRGGPRQALAQIQTSTGTYYLNPASSTVGLVPDGVWSHLAFTYDAAGGADNFKLYLNGQLIASTTATGTLATGDGLFFTGLYGIWDVAELRLWNVARTQAQIAATMKQSLVGNEPGLNAYYTFKNTTQDLTGHGNDGILMYMEQYIRQTILNAGAGPAIDLLLLLD